MNKSLNKPYVKTFDQNGDIINPILTNYPGRTSLGKNSEGKEVFYPNRRERRFKSRPFNNRKGSQRNPQKFHQHITWWDLDENEVLKMYTKQIVHKRLN